jgi:PhoPQ-activated pathogenicity-related protein
MLHMKRTRYFLILVLVAILVAGCAHTVSHPPLTTARETKNTTALDRYVAKPDSHYEYHLVNTFKGAESTGYVFEMTSQTWRSPAEVDRTVWKHWLTIVVPAKVKSSTALMVISGGGNGGEAPKGGEVNLHRIAADTNAVVAEIKMIPNQPLTFSDDHRARHEDSTVAYTWDKYMRTGDEEWPLRLPMTKGVVRGMDTVQAFCKTPEGGKKEIDSFVVAGASKRGWTTWTTAIVDNRVIAIVPIVIDMLNIIPSFEHHKAVYGDWAPAIKDYVDMKIMDWMHTPEYAALMKIVEPYSYRDRLTMPKLLMNSCGDQFFCPDSWRFYLSDLKGPTYLRYVPNTGHGLNASAYESVESFFHSVVKGAPLPKYRWTFPDDQTIRVETPATPTAVKLWQATNPDARDFRLDKVGEIWKAADLADQGHGVYVGRVAKPEKGWTAYLIELTFAGPGQAPIRFTTPVRIVPDVLPYTYEPVKEPPKGFLSK